MMKSKKNGQLWKVLVLIAAFAWVTASFVIKDGVSASAAEIPISTITATLVAPGGAINPHGLATYNVYASGARELEIESQDVNAVGAKRAAHEDAVANEPGVLVTEAVHRRASRPEQLKRFLFVEDVLL